MPINPQQINFQRANIQAPNFAPVDYTGAIDQGLKWGQQMNLNRGMKENAAGALSGDEEALNAIAMLPGGSEIATNLQAITQSRNEAAIKSAQKQIQDRAYQFAAIRNEPDDFKRKKLLQKAAIQQLGEEKDREGAAETMRIANLEDIDELNSELDYGIALAAAGDKYLQGFQENRTGDVKKQREENRRVIANSQTGLNARIDAIETAYDKVDSLVDAAKGIGEPGGKPNRTAVSSVLVGVVKLQDPNSAVLVAEMENAINQTNPVAAVIDLLRSRGTSEEAIKSTLAKIDPLSPENIDPVAIRSTASALVRANIRPMQLAYQDNLIKAQNLAPSGAQSVMAGNFGQRLFDMNSRFNTAQDDQNSQRLTYNEINQQRAMLGMEPLIIPQERSFFRPGQDGLVDGLNETQWNRRQQLLKKR